MNEKRWRHRVVYLFVVISALSQPTFGKTVSGSFQLSGKNSEAILASFAVSPFGRGWIGVTLSSEHLYEDERFLKLHVYQDSNWSKFQREVLCTDKKKHATQTIGLDFNYDRKEWRAHFGVPLNQEAEPRSHYWYIVIDDCSLEQQFRDNQIPRLHYELQMWNDVGGNVYKTNEQGGANAEMQQEKVVTLTHLSADEVGLDGLHIVTLVISLLIAGLMGMHIATLLYKTNAVHAALFLEMVAAIFDALSSICELIHRRRYASDGIGIYFVDACSSHFEAMCDSIVALLLLSIASGWTLPSDAIVVPQQGSFVQSLVSGMRNPAGALVSCSPAGMLALFIVASHAFLAQWGRTYNDDFDSYHALEHFPGRVLMLFRVVLGLLLIVACVQTRNQCAPSLQSFYTKLALVGTVWFQSLPLVTWTCSWAVPYYLRHRTVAIWTSMVQSTALVLLAWLFTAHSRSSYHKVSRLQNNDSLTDQLASGPPSSSSSRNGGGTTTLKTWSFGKTKIRLD